MANQTKRWGTSRPPVGWPVDASYAQQSALLLATLCNEEGGLLVNDVSGFGRVGIVSGGAVRAAGTKDAVVRTTDTNVGTGVDWGAQAWTPTGSECTVVFGYRKTDATLRASSAWGVDSGTDGNRLGTHCPYSDGTVYWDYGGSTGNNRLTYSSGVFGDDIWAFTVGAARGSEIWQNGILRASNTAATGLSRGNTGTDHFWFGKQVGVAQPDLADYRHFFLFAAQLPVETVIALTTTDPYQMFQAPVRRLWGTGAPAPTPTATVFLLSA